MKKREKPKERIPPDQLKITKLVREIISGRPVNQIPDKLLPRVHIELSCAKERAMKEGLINRIQMIQKVMLNVEQYEKERSKLKSAKPRSKNSFFYRKDNSLFGNEDFDYEYDEDELKSFLPNAVLDSILDDLADGIPYEIAETRTIPSLINRSKERIDEYLQSGEYFTAQKYENVHVQLVTLLEERKTERKIENKVNYLTKLLHKNQEKLKEILDEKDRKLEEHEHKVNDSLTKSQNEYDQTNREYDEITNGPLPASARKFSSEYLNTREKERFLIQSRRYEEAATIKAIADRMEEKELEMLWLDFIEKREKKKKIIEERQNKALNCIIENGERTKLKIINEYDSKISELQRTVENIQNRIKLTDCNASIDQNPSSNQEIKKNPSKVTLPAVPRETTTSKLRSSPFVTQATPQITSPDKSNLNRNRNKVNRKEKTLDKPKMTHKFKLAQTTEKETAKKSSFLSFSSNSFISSDNEQADEGDKKNTESQSKQEDEAEIEVVDDEQSNANSSAGNNSINSIDDEQDNNNNSNNGGDKQDNNNTNNSNNGGDKQDNNNTNNSNNGGDDEFTIEIDDENNKNEKSDKNDAGNIAIVDNSIDSNNNNDDDDFVVDDNEVENAANLIGSSKSKSKSRNANLSDGVDVLVGSTRSRASKAADVGKNLIKKRKKSDVTQPNYQMMKNKSSAFNHEYHRPPSVQRKISSPPKRSRSQVREQPPSPHLFNSNFSVVRKNDRIDNPIRVGKSRSKK